MWRLRYRLCAVESSPPCRKVPRAAQSIVDRLPPPARTLSGQRRSVRTVQCAALSFWVKLDCIVCYAVLYMQREPRQGPSKCCWEERAARHQKSKCFERWWLAQATPRQHWWNWFFSSPGLSVSKLNRIFSNNRLRRSRHFATRRWAFHCAQPTLVW